MLSLADFLRSRREKSFTIILNKLAMSIRVAIIGVGNLAASLVQLILKGSDPAVRENVGGYKVSDIEIVAAVDVDARKVGKDLSEAIFVSGDARKAIDVPKLGIEVLPGKMLDEMPNEAFPEGVKESEDFVDALKEADIVINAIYPKSHKSSRYYAEKALEAKAAFINVTNSPIANDKEMQKKFAEAGLPIVGDMLLGQAGSGALHRELLEFFVRRGAIVKETYQLDIAGGIEGFLNFYEPIREEIKRYRSAFVRDSMPIEEDKVVSGSSDYVDFMRNARTSYLRFAGYSPLNAPFEMDVRFTHRDGPDAVAILADVIRATKLAMDRGVSGYLESVGLYGFQITPIYLPLHVAERLFEDFINGRREI